MVAFADGVHFHREFDDFDALMAAAAAWKVQAARVDSAPFAAQLDLAMTGEMQLLHLRSNSGLIVTGETPRGSAGIGFIHAPPGSVRSLGRPIDTTISAPGRLRPSEVHFLGSGAFEQVVVTADQGLFEDHLQARLQSGAVKQGTDWLLRTLPGKPTWPERGQAIIGLLAVLSSGAVSSAAAKHRFQECVLHILLDGTDTDVRPGAVATYAARLRLARAAEEVLRARLDDPPSLSELCGLLGVPVRTLHAAFHEGFGMAPKAYLRALRLSAVHRRLRCARGTVTEAATDLGFFHFGRFSREYRDLFGEAPSETLRRASGAGLH